LGQNRLLDVGALIIAVLAVVKIAVVLPKQVKEYDFAHYYVWSRLLVEGKDPYLTPAEPLYAQYGFVFYKVRPTATNPPPLLWLFVPFALLTPSQAFAGWFLVQAASLCAILWLTRRLLFPGLSARGWRFVCAGAVASDAVYVHFCSGQVQLLLAALLLAAYVLHRQRRDTAACLVVAAAGLLKPYIFLLLPWFLWRGAGSARARTGRIISVLGFSALTVLITNIHLWQHLIQRALPVVTSYAMGPVLNFSLPSFIANVGRIVHSPMPLHIWWTTGELVGLGLIVLGYILCWRGSGDPEAEFCLLCIAMLAGNLVAWGHYFVFLIFPMAVGALRLAANPSAIRIIGFGLVTMAVNDLNEGTGQLYVGHVLAGFLLNYVPLYGLLAMAVFFMNELRVGRPNKSSIENTIPAGGQ
jgi:hypothetical protein